MNVQNRQIVNQWPIQGLDFKGHPELNRGIVAINKSLPYRQGYRKKLLDNVLTFRDKLEIMSLRIRLKPNLILFRLSVILESQSSTYIK